MPDCFAMQAIFTLRDSTNGIRVQKGFFLVSLTTPLNWETLEEVLPVAGVLVTPPLLSCVTKGKGEEKDTMQESHHKDGREGGGRDGRER
jgi:hypothetical protein